MTMLFLPVTAVASICGTNYFQFDSDTRSLLVANNFGIFWAVTVPLTAAVFVGYGLFYAKFRKRLEKVPKTMLQSWSGSTR